MSKTKPLEVVPFDAAEYLKDESSIAAFLNASREMHDPTVLLNALSTVARARSMTDLAQASGLGRESLYKALRPGAQPRYETVVRVMDALGVEMVFRPKHPSTGSAKAGTAILAGKRETPVKRGKIEQKSSKAQRATARAAASEGATANSKAGASGRPRTRKK